MKELPEAINKEEQKKHLGHLKEGVRHIMAAIGTPKQFEENPGAEQEVFKEYPFFRGDKDKNKNKNLAVNYYDSPEDLEEQGFKNKGYATYVISTVDSADKTSNSFLNCTGVIVAGRDKKTGAEVSFLSHQDPNYFLRTDNNREKFVEDMRDRLQEVKDMCEEGTIDAVIIGGNYFSDNPNFIDDYRKSIKLLGKEIEEVLGFEPTVMTGPKNVVGGRTDDVYYDTQNRRLYIIRSSGVGDKTSENYQPSEFEEKEEGWK